MVKKIQVLRDERGFSTILLVVLGMAFFLIVAATAMYLQSEDNQMVSTARAASGGSRLNFLSQAIQADFYNNLLQNNLEVSVSSFLMEGPYTIDPTRSFYENLGGLLETYLSSKASLIVYGDAGQTYSVAYSEISQISCTPRATDSASASFSVAETSDGALELSGLSVGQRIYCEDTEDNSNLEIVLTARGYRLQTRALEIFEKARQAILTTKDRLDNTDGVRQLGSGWRLPTDEDSKNGVIQDWSGKISVLSLLIPSLVGENNGISVVQNSIKIKPPDSAAYQVSDLSRFECYGDVKSADEGGRIQTCRPEDLIIMLGKKKSAGEKGLDLKLEGRTEDAKIEVTISYFGMDVKLESKALAKLIGPVIEELLKSPEGFKDGYATYGSSVTICNAFRGKPNSAVVEGTVVEKNPKYAPSGTTDLLFRFISTDQGVKDSYIDRTADCSDKQDIINTNLLDILTKGGEGFELHVNPDPSNGNKPKIDQDDLNELAKKIQSNPIYLTGENRVVNIKAEVEGGSTSTGTGTPISDPGGTAITPASKAISTSTLAENSEEKKNLDAAVKTGNRDNILNAVKNLADSGVGEMTSLGRTGDANALSKTSSAVCKMMGLANWKGAGDVEMTIAALCGMSNIFNVTDGKAVCNLMGLYQAIKSGSVQASLAQLIAMLNDANLRGILPTAAQIEAAVKSGDIEAVLAAAASAAASAGDIDTARFLAGAASLVYNIRNGIQDVGDVMNAAAALFAALGDREMADFFYSMNGLYHAVESGNVQAIIDSVGKMAKNLGYSGIAQFAGIISQGMNMVNMFTNFDQLLASCKGKGRGPWDLICVVPQVGGGVCESNWGSCTFSQGLPTFDLNLLCNELIFDFGFQIDCTCIYTCPNFPYTIPVPKSVRVNLKDWLILLNPDMYAGIFNQLQVCRMDP